MRLAPGGSEVLARRITRLIESDDFANGDTMRTLFERAVAAQAVRVSRAADLGDSELATVRGHATRTTCAPPSRKRRPDMSSCRDLDARVPARPLHTRIRGREPGATLRPVLLRTRRWRPVWRRP